MHPAMKHVAAVRKKLGIRTIFNILGPLANPAGASHQLLGAGRPELRPLLASALRLLGIERALVVSGEDGLGEVTLAGATHVTEVSRGEERELDLSPEDFGLRSCAARCAPRRRAPPTARRSSAACLAGEPGPPATSSSSTPPRVADRSTQPLSRSQRPQRAAAAIDSGAAADCCGDWRSSRTRD